VKNRMLESGTSGSVGGEGGNLLVYPANPPYGILGGAMETSASFEARSAPSSYPTTLRPASKTSAPLRSFWTTRFEGPGPTNYGLALHPPPFSSAPPFQHVAAFQPPSSGQHHQRDTQGFDRGNQRAVDFLCSPLCTNGSIPTATIEAAGLADNIEKAIARGSRGLCQEPPCARGISQRA
jgi:hypothetical protein